MFTIYIYTHINIYVYMYLHINIYMYICIYINVFHLHRKGWKNMALINNNTNLPIERYTVKRNTYLLELKLGSTHIYKREICII